MTETYGAEMTDREDLIQAIRELAIVRGRVTLASGREADYYVDMRRVTLDGAASPLVGRVMEELVADLDFDAVGGLTLGADPVAASMLHTRAARGGRLDAFVVRKEAKSHGLQRRVLVVEDTSTTGGSALTAVDAVRQAGGEVVAVAVIVDRDTGAAERIAGAGLEYRHAIGLADLGL